MRVRCVRKLILYTYVVLQFITSFCFTLYIVSATYLLAGTFLSICSLCVFILLR